LRKLAQGCTELLELRTCLAGTVHATQAPTVRLRLNRQLLESPMNQRSKNAKKTITLEKETIKSLNVKSRLNAGAVDGAAAGGVQGHGCAVGGSPVKSCGNIW